MASEAPGNRQVEAGRVWAQLSCPRRMGLREPHAWGQSIKADTGGRAGAEARSRLGQAQLRPRCACLTG